MYIGRGATQKTRRGAANSTPKSVITTKNSVGTAALRVFAFIINGKNLNYIIYSKLSYNNAFGRFV